jgi:hypothetical protein
VFWRTPNFVTGYAASGSLVILSRVSMGIKNGRTDDAYGDASSHNGLRHDNLERNAVWGWGIGGEKILGGRHLIADGARWSLSHV